MAKNKHGTNQGSNKGNEPKSPDEVMFGNSGSTETNNTGGPPPSGEVAHTDGQDEEDEHLEADRTLGQGKEGSGEMTQEQREIARRNSEEMQRAMEPERTPEDATGYVPGRTVERATAPALVPQQAHTNTSVGHLKAVDQAARTLVDEINSADSYALEEIKGDHGTAWRALVDALLDGHPEKARAIDEFHAQRLSVKAHPHVSHVVRDGTPIADNDRPVLSSPDAPHP